MYYFAHDCTYVILHKKGKFYPIYLHQFGHQRRKAGS
jgi:hypothetical protein